MISPNPNEVSPFTVFCNFTSGIPGKTHE